MNMMALEAHTGKAITIVSPFNKPIDLPPVCTMRTQIVTNVPNYENNVLNWLSRGYS